MAEIISNTPQTSDLSTSLVLPAIPIREGVLFPSTESVLTFGRALSKRAIKAASAAQNQVILLTQRNSNKNSFAPGDLYETGTLAIIEKTLDGGENINALVRGIARVKVLSFHQEKPHLLVNAVRLPDIEEKDAELQALVSHLQKEFRKAVHMGKPVEFLNFMKLMAGVTNGELVDQIASTLNISTVKKQKVLQTISVKERMKLVIGHLAEEMQVMKIEKDVMHKTQKSFDKNMRENVLRERLRTIQKELGELEDEEEIVLDYETKLKRLRMDTEGKARLGKEIRRLRQMSPNNPEAGYIRTWLDTIFELPWGKLSKSTPDLEKAEKILAKQHYGLEKVKDRILEYIAVLTLKQRAAKTKNAKLPTILCFVGPPGVGKTSIGRSIADSLGRKFVKASLGGVRDEAEIRGHRRTYVGALPGRIMTSIKQAGTSNPVIMLDEIDKLGADFRGDPSAALLEALDPEQNNGFEDHYIDFPFDLSQVIFITTANTLDTIPPALRDRLEVIRYSGYTQEEKFQIAKRHLLKKVLAGNGLNKKMLTISDSILQSIISRYTQEAGVRGLERVLGKIARKAARVHLSKNLTAKKGIAITKKLLAEFLGPAQYDEPLAEKEDSVGVATGLAWTSVGGDVLFVEVALTPGKGTVQLTGQLGDVMKESAQAALTYVKAHAKELGISEKKLNKSNVHVHVPEGAVPKDGPSAGVTIATAMVSAFTNAPIRKEVAMTGEISLRGRVMRIGGLKEKSIAAHRAGCTTILIPKDNQRDLVDIPKTVRDDITFLPMNTINDVLQKALRL
ncbi:MAG: endopeptidase La [Candidatus Pacebacteria bacterium]|nr:endopeptidase La [Candidatus Paceibacterota bacterium]PIR60261.1 MAG: endopeptidase La [Candidatus Pacebacteria bacterium CG10_big_fil_rev_8_21_14_0_10_44_54]